jgi:hypothetical protein
MFKSAAAVLMIMDKPHRADNAEEFSKECQIKKPS